MYSKAIVIVIVFQDQCPWKTDLPSILSVCLISLEPDSVLRLMHDQFTPGESVLRFTVKISQLFDRIPDERFRQVSANQCNLSTPKDVSVTHILVFPTSATAQVSDSFATFYQDICQKLIY